jgi:cyclic pyranopterin phosphate synthase
MKDLRISITDRCNFKCFYCKSALVRDRKERAELLTFEEIVRLARLFTGLGVRKVRITGGEPMARRGVCRLIEQISRLSGIEDLALTTNGFNLAEKADELKAAGLRRVTVSLDSLRPQRFETLTGSRGFDRVLDGIVAARRAGLAPIKINCVLVRGFNDDEVFDFAELARSLELTVRFIEFMPLDEDAQWRREKVVTGAETLATLRSRYEMVELGRAHSHSTSEDFRFADAPGVIGLIMPVSVPFCGQCSRIRLTADGKIRTCLFSQIDYDVKALMRSGADDTALAEFIIQTTGKKERGHRINKRGFVPPSRTMSFIGG